MASTNIIAQLAKEFQSGDTSDLVDVITFVEASWGLNLRLFPVQKFVLKCASGDNLIIGDDGVSVTLRDYHRAAQSKVTTYDETDGKLKQVHHEGTFCTGKKKVFRLTTEFSRRWVELTSDHFVLTPNGYRRLDSLNKGDWITVSKDEPFPNYDSGLLRLANSDVCGDRVWSIEDMGEKDVYDVSVPVTHNFCLNGVLVHNCYYGLPLDDQYRTIEIPDIINEKLVATFTEADFLKWLYDEKRCNTDTVEGKQFRDLVLVMGRRSGKSTLSACISNYELYKLVKRGDPCNYYGTPPQFPIAILNVAPTDEQASVVFDMIQTMALRCPYLKDRNLNKTMTYFNLQTDDDRHQAGKRASLVSIAGGCSSNALRGRNAIGVIMDEMAFFIDNGGRFSGDEVWRALQPSTTTFKGDGKVITISSPYGKFGKFWDLYNDSFEFPDYSLMFKMYSAMVNPNIPMEDLRVARRRNRVAFMSEYGGEFSDAVTAWIDDEHEFRRCIHVREIPDRGVPGVKYYWGLDLGFKNDGTAIVIVHKEGRKIVLDYANVWFSGSSDVWEIDDSIYRGCNKYAYLDLLRMADIVEEIKALHRWFPITAGIFDQKDGYGLMELLQEEQLEQFEMKYFTDTLNHQVYELAKRLYSEELIDLFDDSVLIPELLTLEAEKRTGRNSIPRNDETLEGFKGKVIVRAPRRKGAHDDLCLPPDALIVTRNGPKPICEFDVGDEVLTHNRRWKRVEHVSRRSDAKELVELKVVRLGVLRLTPNHPIYIWRNGRKQFVPAGKVKKGDKVIYSFDMTTRRPGVLSVCDYLECRESRRNRAGLLLSDVVIDREEISYVNGRSNPINSRVELTPDVFRLFGYYVAEGSSGHHCVSFAFAKHEVDYVNDVIRLMKDCFGLEKHNLSEGHGVLQLRFNSIILRDVFSGLFGIGASNKSLPDWIMIAPFDFQEEFVRGYWRGDGCFASNGAFVFTTVSLVLAHQVRDMLLRLGVVSGIDITQRAGRIGEIRGRKFRQNHDLCNVRCQSLWDVTRLAEILDVSLTGRNLRATSERFVKFGEFYAAVRGVGVVDYEGDVYNLSVEDDRSYTTVNGTVHNSDAWSRAIWLCSTTTSDRKAHVSTGVGGSVRASHKVASKFGMDSNRPQLNVDRVPLTQKSYALKKQKMHGVHPRGIDRLRRKLPGAVR